MEKDSLFRMKVYCHIMDAIVNKSYVEPSEYVRGLYSSGVKSAKSIECSLLGESVTHMHTRIDRITIVAITSS